MKLSQILVISAAAGVTGSGLLEAQQAAAVTGPEPEVAVPAVPAGPDVDAITALQEAGITRKQYGANLIASAYDGNAITMQTLLEAGAHVNTRDSRTGGTALHAAAQGGHEECIQVLIAHGADVHQRTRDGETAVFVAAKNGHTECVLALVAAGCDVRKKDDDGKSPLLWVARNGDTECVKALVAAGAVCDAITATIILLAAAGLIAWWGTKRKIVPTNIWDAEA